MKPEDIFYYSEKRSWFTKHALSVERVGLNYIVKWYKNNKLMTIQEQPSLFYIQDWLKVWVENEYFSRELLSKFLKSITKNIRNEDVLYKIKGVCLGQVDHAELGYVNVYHTFNGYYCIHLLNRNVVESRCGVEADLHECLVDLALKDNITTYTFE